MLVEVIEHLQAPWSTLREAAKPGLSRRLDRCLDPERRDAALPPGARRARKATPFRVDNLPHISPALPHVTIRVLGEEGLACEPTAFAGADVIPITGGRTWPEPIRARAPRLLSVSAIVAAQRPA